jgi:hypothetical protein
MRLLDKPVQLWDVENVEAHVRGALEAGLAKKGARLNAKQYDRALQFLRIACWNLSGLQADAKTLRYVWVIRGFVAPAGSSDRYELIKLDEFGSEASAERALAAFRDDLTARGRRLAFAGVHRQRPAGAYDPSKGISFSTYSWRLCSDPRLTDWYRSDEDFGDTRYENNRQTELSLEALSTRAHEDGDEVGDAPAPIGRLEIVDQLNPHAYQDAGEEVLTREAFGF